MPTTINGVGTHYYGKKNQHSRRGVCQHCGRESQLTSYDTRHWFVFFFIPIIPLGRKRIIDKCSSCTYHFASDATEWETGKQSEMSASMDRFRKESSAETALDVHAQLMKFHQHEEATDFREAILKQFPQSSELRAGLAAHLDYIGYPQEATELWQQSYQMDPELPEARQGMAIRSLQEGKPEEARDLLHFLEQPGAEKQYDMTPLFTLAECFQNKNDHEQTLEITGILLKAFPDLGQDSQFRKFVKKSQKATNSLDSTLPPADRSFRRLFGSKSSSGLRVFLGVVIVSLITVVGGVISNEYIRRHRPLTIINATGIQANIQVDDQPSVTMSGKQTIELAEGTYRIQIKGPVEEQHTLEISSDYFSRWTNNPSWIVNVGGEGVIAESSVFYAEKPRPTQTKYLTNTIIRRKHVDYPFEAPPDSITVDNKKDVVTKTMLSWVDMDDHPNMPVNTFAVLMEQNREQALTFAEQRLHRDPEDSALLHSLVAVAKPQDMHRLQTLLEAKLDHRPINVEWHRMYQELPTVSRAYQELLEDYDALLAEAPNNSKLLYLRARIEIDPQRYLKLLEQAIDSDPNFPWPFYARCYSHLSTGSWQLGLDDLQRASEAGMTDDDLQAHRHLARLGLSEHQKLIDKYSAIFAQSPANLSVASLLAEVHVIRGEFNEADRVVSTATRAYRDATGNRFLDRVYLTEAMLAYNKNDLQACEAHITKSNGLKYLAETIAPEVGATTLDPETYQISAEYHKAWLPLIQSIALYLQDDKQMANKWYQIQLKQLEHSGAQMDQFRKLLSTPEVTEELLDEVLEIHQLPMQKALILTSVGLHTSDPNLREKFFREAKRFMVRRIPPYHLMKRVHATKQ